MLNVGDDFEAYYLDTLNREMLPNRPNASNSAEMEVFHCLIKSYGHIKIKKKKDSMGPRAHCNCTRLIDLIAVAGGSPARRNIRGDSDEP